MILMACACFPPEPVVAATLTHDLAKRLSADHQVRVLTPSPSRPHGFKFGGDVARSNEFEHVVLPSYTCSRSDLLGRIRESYSFGHHVARYIRKHHPTIQFVYVCSWPLLAPYLILKSAHRYSIPTIFHIEDIYPESFANKIPIVGGLVKRCLLPMDGLVMKMASRIIAVSENMKRHCVRSRKVPPGKIALIHNWQDEDEFLRFHDSKHDHQENPEADKPFTFMYLGNIGPLSGIEYVIQGFHKACIPNSKLVIAGAGTMKAACMRMADKLDNRTIRFVDVPHGMVPEIQDEADVMILHVRRGGAFSSVPSKLPAYMFSKKPVIACVDNGSDTANAVMAAKCGWVVPPEDIGQLVLSLHEAANTPCNELLDMGIHGFDYAMEHFSKRNNLDKMIQLISETLRA